MKRILLILSLIVIITLAGCTSEHDDLHDHSVEIEGSEMNFLTVQQVADLWEIDSETLLINIVTEFELEGNYTTESILEDIREEYSFSPALIKDMAEEMKQQEIQNE